MLNAGPLGGGALVTCYWWSHSKVLSFNCGHAGCGDRELRQAGLALEDFWFYWETPLQMRAEGLVHPPFPKRNSLGHREQRQERAKGGANRRVSV